MVIPVDSTLAFVDRPLAVAAAIRVVVAQCGADMEALDVHEVDLGWGGRAHEVRDDGLALPPRLAFEGIAPLDQVTEQVEDLTGDVNVAGVEQVVERPLELIMGYRMSATLDCNERPFLPCPGPQRVCPLLPTS